MPIHNDSLLKQTAICIPVLNEGERIISQLTHMQEIGIMDRYDVYILDAQSTDHSLNSEKLKPLQVKAVLVKTSEGKQGSQLRIGFQYCIEKGYQYIITLDGNNKDQPEFIDAIQNKLNEGYDYVQGSRYLKGGFEKNTPWIRKFASRMIHAPLLSFKARFHYTDTTNNFRGYKIKVLKDPKLDIFRNVFQGYNLLAYLSAYIPRLGYRCVEVPVGRVYPEHEKVPTKISFLRGNGNLLMILFKTCLGCYAPSKKEKGSTL